jgi:hypothetical protein
VFVDEQRSQRLNAEILTYDSQCTILCQFKH